MEPVEGAALPATEASRTTAPAPHARVEHAEPGSVLERLGREAPLLDVELLQPRVLDLEARLRVTGR